MQAGSIRTRLAGGPARVIVPVAVSLLLLALAIPVFVLPNVERRMIDDRRTLIKELTNSVWSLLRQYQRLVEAGTLTEPQAKELAVSQVRSLRYGEDDKDYFWINDMQPCIVVHPYRQDLEGQDVSTFEDPAGQRLFVSFVKAVRDSGSGYVEYMWQWKDNPNRIVPKLSYVRSFEPWGWVVGTGVYLEDVRAEIAGITHKLRMVFAAVLLVVSALLGYIIWNGLDMERRRREAERALRESEKRLRRIVDHSPIPMMIAEQSGDVVALNQRFTELYGYALADIPTLGRWWQTAYPDYRSRRDARAQWEVAARARSSGAGQPDTLETLIACKDGRRRHVQSSLVMVGDFAVKTVNDVTNLREYQRDLQSRTLHLETMDLVNTVIRQAGRAEDLMSEVLRVAREALDCSAVWLLHADDHTQTHWSVAAVSSDPNCGEAAPPPVDQPVPSSAMDELSTVLSSATPVRLPDDHPEGLPCGMARAPVFSRVAYAVFPKGDFPWVIGVCQCGGPVQWSVEDLGLLIEIAERTGEALANFKSLQDLQVSEERYRQLVESMNDGLVVIDSNEQYTYVNPRMAEMLGYSVDELLGRSPYSIVDEANAEILADQLARRRRGLRAPYEITWRRKDGTPLQTILSPQPVLGQDGEFLGSFAVVTDISRLKQAEEAIRDSEARYRTLFEAASDAIFLVEDFRFVECNSATLGMFGCTREQLMGAGPADFSPERQPNGRESGEVAIERMRAALGGTPQRLTWAHKRPDGTLFDAEVTLNAVLLSGKTLLQAFVRDVTERNRVEAERQRLAGILQSTSDFVATATAEGELVYVNQAGLRMLGWNDGFTGRAIADCHPQWAADLIMREAIPITTTSGIWDGETALLSGDGEEIPVSQVVIAHHNERGELEFFSTIMRDIRNRKRTERALKASLRLLQMSEATPLSEVFQVGLEEAVRLSDSAIGFFHTVDPDQKSIKLTTWSRRTVEQCAIPGLVTHYPIDQAGRWVDCIRERRPIIHNDFQSLPNRRELPPGHVAMIREMTIPVFDGDRIVAILGVGNKPTDYTQFDIDQLSLLAKHTWSVIQRRAAEEALKDSREEYRSLSENSTDCIVRFDRDGRYLYVNDAGVKLLQRPEAAILERTHRDLDIDESACRQYERAIDAVYREARAQAEIISFEQPDGKIVMDWSFTPEFADDGSVATVLAVGRDITAITVAESALRKSMGTLNAIFRAAPTGIGLVAHRVFKRVNDQLCLMLGYSAEELLGNNARMVYASDAEYERVGTVKYGLIKEHGSGTLETKWRCKDGQIIDVLLSSSPIDAQDWGAGVTFTALDITRSKQTERERERLIAELEKKNAELERFACTVSHDLKSPLITISGFAGLLQRHLSSNEHEQGQNDIRRITNASGRMHELLNDLLEVSRVGRVTGEPTATPAAELFADALALVSGQLTQHRVRVTVDDSLPVLYGDRPRLLQVAQNLLDNAAKYMGSQPHPHIHVGQRRDGRRRLVFVRDNGMGIKPDFHSRVFDLFHRLDPRTEGSGVGLALVKRIVESHGGHVWVESDGEGHGSTFFLDLPTVEEQSDSVAAEPRSLTVTLTPHS
jgi:PAS domain S-box-containing protein